MCTKLPLLRYLLQKGLMEDLTFCTLTFVAYIAAGKIVTYKNSCLEMCYRLFKVTKANHSILFNKFTSVII